PPRPTLFPSPTLFRSRPHGVGAESTMRICSITVRAGSKGVPGKNLRLVAGKPLFGHSVAQAVATGLFDEVVVSSDSEEILELAPDRKSTRLNSSHVKI